MKTPNLKPFLLSILLLCTPSIHADEQKLPQWIQDKIKSGRPLHGIEKYEFKKSTLYLVQTVCCDRGERELYDDKGKLICKLKESFVGLDYSKCPEFTKEKKWIASVYSKPLTPDQAKWRKEDEKLAEAARKIVLTDESYGPIKFGSKLSDIEKTVGEKASNHSYEGYSDKCRYVGFEKFEAVSLRVEDGVVTGLASMRFDWVTTSLGIKDSMQLSDVKSKYPEMRIVPSPYGDHLQYAVFDSKDQKRALVFTVSDGRFFSVDAGLRPSITDVPNRCIRK